MTWVFCSLLQQKRAAVCISFFDGARRRIHICMVAASAGQNFAASITCSTVRTGTVAKSFTATSTRGSLGEVTTVLVYILFSELLWLVAALWRRNEEKSLGHAGLLHIIIWRMNEPPNWGATCALMTQFPQRHIIYQSKALWVLYIESIFISLKYIMSGLFTYFSNTASSSTNQRDFGGATVLCLIS